MEKQKRHRGGQPGNQNARKHAYYAAVLDSQNRSDLKKAAGLEGIDEEIIILRLLIAQATSCGDYRTIKTLTKTMKIIGKLLVIKKKAEGRCQERIRLAVNSLGRELYQGWLGPGRPAAGHDITDFNESQRMERVEAKVPALMVESSASPGLAGTKK
jgi:hypothetical protein